jgi:hypothetical protein
MKHCPACGSDNVRRSSIRSEEVRVSALHSPYRCRACGSRFWVVSRRARRGIAVLALAGAALVFMAAGSVLTAHKEAAPPTEADAPAAIGDADPQAKAPGARPDDHATKSAEHSAEETFPRLVPPARSDKGRR